MKNLVFRILILLALVCLWASCNSQPDKITQPTYDKNNPVGGGCDGCELMYIGMPENIDAVDTSAGWSEKGQKLLVTGTVYKIDGETPAPDVIIYYWQTDNNGYYSPGKNMNEKAKRHGHIRGWVKTDANGRYSIYTIRPAPYPNRSIPAHIHTSIKESNIKNEYYIDEFVFDDDKLLTGAKRKALENRGGSGILRILFQVTYKLQNTILFWACTFRTILIQQNRPNNQGFISEKIIHHSHLVMLLDQIKEPELVRFVNMGVM